MSVVSLALSLPAQESSLWHDPSPHRVQFVSVDGNVRLEVLDWGGSGRPIVLLAGNGNTAHVFDDFAPKLTTDHHVYGITRRGFGASSAPSSGYSADRLADDVLAVLDALKLAAPVLVGHSIAVEELSSVGSRYPKRVAGLVYLDAGYEYAYYNGPESKVPYPPPPPPTPIPQRPPPSAADLQSFATLRAWEIRGYGFATPEAELRQCCEPAPDGRIGKRRAGSNAGQLVIEGIQKYTNIPVPILAIFAVPHDLGKWTSDDPAAQAAANAFYAHNGSEAYAKAFESGVPTARVVRIRANHFVFLSNEAEVLREMRVFLATLN